MNLAAVSAHRGRHCLAVPGCVRADAVAAARAVGSIYRGAAPPSCGRGRAEKNITVILRTSL